MNQPIARPRSRASSRCRVAPTLAAALVPAVVVETGRIVAHHCAHVRELPQHVRESRSAGRAARTRSETAAPCTGRRATPGSDRSSCASSCRTGCADGARAAPAWLSIASRKRSSPVCASRGTATLPALMLSMLNSSGSYPRIAPSGATRADTSRCTNSRDRLSPHGRCEIEAALVDAAVFVVPERSIRLPASRDSSSMKVRTGSRRCMRCAQPAHRCDRLHGRITRSRMRFDCRCACGCPASRGADLAEALGFEHVDEPVAHARMLEVAALADALRQRGDLLVAIPAERARQRRFASSVRDGRPAHRQARAAGRTLRRQTDR